MPPTNQSTVIELYDPGSYARKGIWAQRNKHVLTCLAADWHLVANMVGHRYYPVHYDEIASLRTRERVGTSGMDGVSLFCIRLLSG
jgi:hypothetical protein